MSTLSVAAIKNLSGVEQYLCKAWVNFDGTGTVAIRASGNVSSITDSGVGTYIVNFTNTFADANYSVAGTASSDGVTYNGCLMAGRQGNSSRTASACYVIALSGGSSAGAAFDAPEISVAVFR